MNIVFHRYNSICEPDFLSAFHALGIDVIEDREEMERKGIPVDERVEKIARLVLENHPIFVFTINFFPYISLVCQRLNVKYVCVSVDCPVPEIYSTAIRNPCNRVFLFDYQQYLSVKDENPECIFYLPLGAAVERIDQAVAGVTGYRYDISLVGSLYKEKDPYRELPLPASDRGYFDGLLAAQSLFPGQALLEECIAGKRERVDALKAADPGFYLSDLSVRNIDEFIAVNNYLSPHLSCLDRIGLLNALARELPEYGTHLFTRSDASDLAGVHVHGGVRSLDEMPVVFRQSRINLNPTIRSIQTGLPQRIWDILACGGFCMSNAQAELPELLEPGKHLETYESLPELIEKTRYYLEHDAEREAIARAGYEEVRARHTVLQRVAEMIRSISIG